MSSEFIGRLCLDLGLRRLQRASHRTIDDVDGAIESLDRLHAETDN